MVNDEGIVLAVIKIKQYDAILYGAGESGYSALRRLIELYGITPLCIVDKDENKIGMIMCGVRVVFPLELQHYIKDIAKTYALIVVKDYLKNENIRIEINSILNDVGIQKGQYITWKSNDAKKYLMTI